jgi:UPF0716 protein FxsA
VFFYLLLAFTFVPAVEIALFVRIGSVIGPFATFAVVVATGIAGASLARSQGVRVLSEIRESLEAGRLPTDELAGGVLVLVGGTLLLTPGFLTDFLGLACLAPVSRHLLATVVKGWFKRRLQEMNTGRGPAGSWKVRVGGVRPGPAMRPAAGARSAQTAAYGKTPNPATTQDPDIRQTGPRTIDANYSVVDARDESNSETGPRTIDASYSVVDAVDVSEAKSPEED